MNTNEQLDEMRNIVEKAKCLLKENFVVMKESMAGFKATGCVCPSSPWAAEALVEPLRNAQGQRRVIEVGAGVGPVTVKVMDVISPDDVFVICEINSAFMKALKKKVKAHKRYEELKDAITFFEGPIQDLPQPENKFNFIVCALPFLNFEKKLIGAIFDKLLEISDESCLMTYFEYMGLRNLGKIISPNERKQRMKEIDVYMSQIYKPRRVNKKKVWLNISPINVYTLKMAA